MATILACDTRAPDFMLRTPDQNLTLRIRFREHNAKWACRSMGSDAVPDCAMTHPVVNQGAACTLAGVCARFRHFRLTDVHPHAQMGLAADIKAKHCETGSSQPRQADSA